MHTFVEFPLTGGGNILRHHYFKYWNVFLFSFQTLSVLGVLSAIEIILVS